jgi:dihydroneopterin aldolase
MADHTKIFIRDFKVDASLGIYEGDDKIITPLSVTIEVWLDLPPVKDDRIESTMSYEILADLARNIPNKHYHLLEFLAEHLFSELFKHEIVTKARIELTKTEMFAEGLCGIDWIRENI